MLDWRRYAEKLDKIAVLYCQTRELLERTRLYNIRLQYQLINKNKKQMKYFYLVTVIIIFSFNTKLKTRRTGEIKQSL